MKYTQLIVLLIVIFSFSLVGCEKEGASEKTGKKIDRAYKSAEKKVGNVFDKVKDTIDEAKK